MASTAAINFQRGSVHLRPHPQHPTAPAARKYEAKSGPYFLPPLPAVSVTHHNSGCFDEDNITFPSGRRKEWNERWVCVAQSSYDRPTVSAIYGRVRRRR
jgi:hypothetical protein